MVNMRDFVLAQQRSLKTLERIIDAAERPKRISITRSKGGKVKSARIVVDGKGEDYGRELEE